MSSFRKRTKVKVLQTVPNIGLQNGYSDDDELHDKQNNNSNGNKQKQRSEQAKDTNFVDKSSNEIGLQNKADADDDDDDNLITTPGTSSTVTAPLHFKRKKKKTKMKVRQGNRGTSTVKLGYDDSEDDDENDHDDKNKYEDILSKASAVKSSTSKINDSDSDDIMQDLDVKIDKPKESQRKKKPIRPPLFANFQDDENEEEDRGNNIENYSSSNIGSGFGIDSTRPSGAQPKSKVKRQSTRQSEKATKQSDDLSYSPTNLKKMISAQKKLLAWNNIQNADANRGNDSALEARQHDTDVEMSIDPPSPPTYNSTDNSGLLGSGSGVILAEQAITKIYDDKTIEQIKAKKLKLQSELAEQAERETIINNGKVTESYRTTTAATTTGLASRTAADKSSANDKIEIDEDFMNDSSDSDLESEAVQQPATKTNSNLTNNQQRSIQSIEKNVISISGDATGEDLEETEFSDKRLAFDPLRAEKAQNEEIKDAIYDYNLEQDISDEDEELAKWENQKIYDALNTGVLAGDFDGAANVNDSGADFDGGSGAGAGTGTITGSENDNGKSSKTTAHDIKQYLKDMQQEKFIDDSFKRFPKLNKVFETIMRELEKPNVGIHVKKSTQKEIDNANENENEGSAVPAHVDLFEVYLNQAKAFSKELETIASKKAEQVQLLKEEEVSAQLQKEKIEQRILDMEKDFEGLDF